MDFYLFCKEYNYANFGEFEFPYYCNGGIFPQDTTFGIEAYNFENGSGFYMGVLNMPGMCYSIIKWDGTPTDYEGIISRDCSFLENTLWLDPQKQEMIYSSTDQLI
ncbi:MAG: hypothetical protein Q7J78_02840 [Clostridiales bacterium]|nr:hypothetical protein [Clostridiales bacterium]